MSNKPVSVSEEQPVKIKTFYHRNRPTTADVDFLLSSNSTVIHHDITATPIPCATDTDYENWKRNLLRTRQAFKVRGLYKSQTLEQVLDQVQTERPLQLISGHLVTNVQPSMKTATRDGGTIEHVKKDIEERNNVFLNWIIPAIHRQLGELRLASTSKLWKKGKSKK